VTVGYEAIVYDLDGTLVELEVDWEAARRDAAAVLRARGVDTDGMGLWEVLESAEPNGVLDRINEAIAEHERAGARSATRLQQADALPHSVPVGVCSLNAEAACRIALELHGLDRHVETIVGRDSVRSYKPDPEPLLATIDGIGAQPSETLFVGDSERDELTANRAGVAFKYARDWTD
jgi:phosphoglycolate phosphatase-like HAD superfamily hydrolase